MLNDLHQLSSFFYVTFCVTSSVIRSAGMMMLLAVACLSMQPIYRTLNWLINFPKVASWQGVKGKSWTSLILGCRKIVKNLFCRFLCLLGGLKPPILWNFRGKFEILNTPIFWAGNLRCLSETWYFLIYFLTHDAAASKQILTNVNCLISRIGWPHAVGSRI